jgi:antitoxin HicB
MEKTIEYYLSLPYTIEMVPEPGGGWFVSVQELPGCISEGDTPGEAIQMIQDAMRGWIELSLEDGDPIPEPRTLEDYSGKFVVRVPRSLHRDLVETAEAEGVSLNQLINVTLARAAGHPMPSQPARREDPGWPGLKRSIKNTLLAAGFAEEAGALDERIFADWVERALSQADFALKQKSFQDAITYLDGLVFGLHASAGHSPVVGTLYRAVLLFREQIDLAQRLCQQIDVTEQVAERISQLAFSANRVQVVYQEERTAYSENSAAQAPVRQFAEALLGRPERTKW